MPSGLDTTWCTRPQAVVPGYWSGKIEGAAVALPDDFPGYFGQPLQPMMEFLQARCGFKPWLPVHSDAESHNARMTRTVRFWQDPECYMAPMLGGPLPWLVSLGAPRETILLCVKDHPCCLATLKIEGVPSVQDWPEILHLLQSWVYHRGWAFRISSRTDVIVASPGLALGLRNILEQDLVIVRQHGCLSLPSLVTNIFKGFAHLEVWPQERLDHFEASHPPQQVRYEQQISNDLTASMGLPAPLVGPSPLQPLWSEINRARRDLARNGHPYEELESMPPDQLLALHKAEILDAKEEPITIESLRAACHDGAAEADRPRGSSKGKRRMKKVAFTNEGGFSEN